MSYDYVFNDGTVLTTERDLDHVQLAGFVGLFGPLKTDYVQLAGSADLNPLKTDYVENEGVYKFHWDCGRQGNVEGLFVLTDIQYAELLGKHVNFGEILGKHSSVYGIVEKSDLTFVTANPVIVHFVKHNTSGYNPLDYVADAEDEDDE